jgi:hypothetical protein
VIGSQQTPMAGQAAGAQTMPTPCEVPVGQRPP